MNLSDNFRSSIRSFSPNYFALVMATGIISTACEQLHYDWLGKFLFYLNNVLFILLMLVFTGRVILYFSDFKNDLANHSKGAGFLTLVAGASILGSEYAQGTQSFSIPAILLIFALFVYVLIIYSFLTLTILKQSKPPFEMGMNGSWLLLTVSTQSIVILTSLLAPQFHAPVSLTLFISLAAWLFGILLYIAFFTIII